MLSYDVCHMFISCPIRSGSFTHSTLFGVNIILLKIPRHPKICHLAFLSFTNKNISGRRVTMDYLKEMSFSVDLLYWNCVKSYFTSKILFQSLNCNYYRLLPSSTTNKPSRRLSAMQTASTALKLGWFPAFYPGY